MKKHYFSDSPWEDKVGYARAVRNGQLIEVAGTTAVKDGEILYPDDAYSQTKAVFVLIEKAINTLGGSMSDVIRTRIYVRDINDWEAIGRAHEEVFGGIRPVSSMIEVNGFIHLDILVEIEVTAWVA